jgi:hypothetical protein
MDFLPFKFPISVEASSLVIHLIITPSNHHNHNSMGGADAEDRKRMGLLHNIAVRCVVSVVCPDSAIFT